MYMFTVFRFINGQLVKQHWHCDGKDTLEQTKKYWLQSPDSIRYVITKNNQIIENGDITHDEADEDSVYFIDHSLINSLDDITEDLPY